MDREDMLKAIETLYEGRRTGDLEKFSEVLAEGAEFRFVGDDSITSAFPGGTDSDPNEVAQKLFEQLDMIERERGASVVEGNQVAVQFKAVLCAKGGEPFEHEMFDLWEFNDEGKITRGSQFQDTAKIIHEMNRARQPA